MELMILIVLASFPIKGFLGTGATFEATSTWWYR
jgi:hypothetical protein